MHTPIMYTTILINMQNIVEATSYTIGIADGNMALKSIAGPPSGLSRPSSRVPSRTAHRARAPGMYGLEKNGPGSRWKN